MSGEDSKMTFEDSSDRSAKPYMGISLLILTLLLGVSVSALVYQSVAVAEPCTQTVQQQGTSAPQSSIDVRSSLTIQTDDNQQFKDDIGYDRTHNVAYYYGYDGSFSVDDFAKGIHLIQGAVEEVCYLVAVGSDGTDSNDILSMLQLMDGSDNQVVRGEVEEVKVEVLPGKVTDTSFIPSAAYQRCVNGYQWMALIPNDVNEDEKREKRAITAAIRRRPCMWRYINGKWKRLCSSQKSHLDNHG